MNSFDAIDPKLIDFVLPHHDGYPDDIAAGDTPDVLRDVCGNAARSFPSELWIEPRDWPDKARDNDKYKTWPLNYLDRFTNQHPTHECTCHMLRALLESCRNRQRGIIFPDGPKKDFRYPESATSGSVWIAPLSVYSEANPRERGGAGVRQVLEISVRRGALPETIQPREYGFRHAIHGTTGKGGVNQARGPWVPMSRMPAGWQETAVLFKPLEVIFPETWEQMVCLLLHGRAVGVGRQGHAVPLAMWNVSQNVAPYPDSYDVIRYDSIARLKEAVRSAFAVNTMTTPDDWNNPAGAAA